MPEERKLVSLVFADVVGSTAWGAQQDPEVVRRSMARYFARMKGIAETHGGTVEKFIGDAVMVVFGVPQLHEDDAERAVRAALAMRDAIADLNRDLGIALAVRIGVNSGDVVTGGGEEERQFLVTGDAVNVVARLQAGAEPDEVVVGALTERLTRDSIEYEARDPIVAKGKPEPVPAFRALRARSAVPVSHGGAPALRATLVGRARELRHLLDSVERTAAERTGYLVTLVGNAGVGKSRLVAELVARLAQREGLRILRGRCLAYGAGITYWPLMDVVREDAGITSSDDRGAVLGKLSARLAALFSSDRLPAVQARIALLLGLEPAAAVLPNVPAERIAVELSWGIRQYLETVAAHETLVLVIDDLQWAEPAVLEVLGQLADRSSTVPVLLVCIARPELLERNPSWAASRSNASLVHLEPLDELDTGTLLSGLLATADVPPPVASLIAERSAGNPLFCEEFLRMLIDAGYLEFADGRWKATRPLGELPLPESIQSIVAARLDGLPPTEKITFQRASVIGEHFALDELLALDGDMGVAPEALVRKGLFVADRDDPSGRSLRFKHLLIRDVAYGSLSKADRAALHDRVGALLEAAKADRRDEFSELLAYHAAQSYLLSRELRLEPDTLAPRSARALRCSTLAGDRALALFATEQAVRHYALGIEIASDDEPMRAELQLRLAEALRRAGDSQRASRAAEDAQEGYARVGDVRGQADALRTQAAALAELEEHDRALLAGEAAAQILAPLGESESLADVHAQIARVRMLKSDWSGAIEAGEHSVSVAQRVGAIEVELDAQVTVGYSMSNLTASVDHGAEGMKRMREAIDLGIARGVIFPTFRGFANLEGAMWEQRFSGDLVRGLAAEYIAHAHKFGFRHASVIAEEAQSAMLDADWDLVLRLASESVGEGSYASMVRIMEAFVTVGRDGPAVGLALLESRRQYLRRLGRQNRSWQAGLVVQVLGFAAQDRELLGFAEDFAELIGRGDPDPGLDAVAVGAIVAARSVGDDKALHRWIELCLAAPQTIAAPVDLRRAYAQGERHAAGDDTDSALVSIEESIRISDSVHSSVPFPRIALRLRRVELLLLRAKLGDREAAASAFSELVPYWRKAKATWYLGQLKHWAADHGLAFSRGGFEADSIVASP
jgi:class 3 adenylate cyclase